MSFKTLAGFHHTQPINQLHECKVRDFFGLGIYVTLAFAVPGALMVTAGVALFPDYTNRASQLEPVEQAGIILLIAFFNAQPAFFAERVLFDKIWDYLHPEYRIGERSTLSRQRARIVAAIELSGAGHSWYDQNLGEFVLYFNTSFWLLILSAVRLTIWPQGVLTACLATFVLVSSIISLLYVAPYFKMAYLDILELYKQEHRTKHNDSPTS